LVKSVAGQGELHICLLFCELYFRSNAFTRLPFWLNIFYMWRKETSLDTRYGAWTRKPATGKTARSIHRGFLFSNFFWFIHLLLSSPLYKQKDRVANDSHK